MEYKLDSEERVPMMGGDVEKHSSSDISEQISLGRKTPSWFARHSRLMLVHLIIFSIYALVMASPLWGRDFAKPAGCKAGIETSFDPAREAISYQGVTYSASPHLKSEYVGEPRPSLDKAWHELLQYSYIRVSHSDLEANNETSIPLGNGGGYLGQMTVFHELHCLKVLRHAFHFKDYQHRYGEEEKQNLGQHIEHCIDVLRQTVMCRADTTLITFGWDFEYGIRLPQPKHHLLHQCVDWDKLTGWLQDHVINPFENGMLIHPIHGPSYPGGFRADRPHPPIQPRP